MNTLFAFFYSLFAVVGCWITLEFIGKSIAKIIILFVMNDKEDVIRKIGYDNWAMFEEFMIDRKVDWDEYLDERVYHPQDVDDFKSQHNIA